MPYWASSQFDEMGANYVSITRRKDGAATVAGSLMGSRPAASLAAEASGSARDVGAGTGTATGTATGNTKAEERDAAVENARAADQLLHQVLGEGPNDSLLLHVLLAGQYDDEAFEYDESSISPSLSLHLRRTWPKKVFRRSRTGTLQASALEHQQALVAAVQSALLAFEGNLGVVTMGDMVTGGMSAGDVATASIGAGAAGVSFAACAGSGAIAGASSGAAMTNGVTAPLLLQAMRRSTFFSPAAREAIALLTLDGLRDTLRAMDAACPKELVASTDPTSGAFSLRLLTAGRRGGDTAGSGGGGASGARPADFLPPKMRHKVTQVSKSST